MPTPTTRTRSLATLAIVACFILTFLASNTFAQSPQQIVAGVDQRIEQHRKGDFRLQLTMPDGSPVPAGAVAQINLTRHDFLFGSNLFSFAYQAEVETPYRQQFERIFNYATLNFIWEFHEPTQHHNEQKRIREIANWCRERNIQTCGHALVWNMEPKWVRDQNAETAEQLLWNRVAKEPRDYRGLIDDWVVLNEATEGLKYAKQRNATGLLSALQRLGTARTIKKSTEVARQGNPKSTLILNDFVTSEAYSRVIQQSLDAGAKIDVIGIQSHMHTGYWKVEKIWDVCNRLAKFDKPIRFTEMSILSGRLKHESDTDWETKRNDWHSTPQGEKIQAAQVYETYRLLFSHPSVEAISWWDLSDRGAWMNAPAGLLRHDMTPKPAYQILDELINKRWHTNEQAIVGNNGAFDLRGFFGTYSVVVDVAGQRLSGTFGVEKGARLRGRIAVPLK